VADAQTAGRGRQGRQWHSPPGVNLYTSIILKPPFRNADVGLFPQIASLAIWDAVRDHGVHEAWIKWPNDIFVDNQKLAGTLAESTSGKQGVEAVVIGIGVNLNMDENERQQIDQPATSVFLETGVKVQRQSFMGALYRYFNHYYHTAQTSGFARLYPAWRGASRLLGRDVRLLVDGRQLEARVVDLEADGALRVALADGSQASYHSGEVSLTAL